MSSRSVVVGITLAVVSVAPLSGVAHAQDLNCRDFRFQEDAQAVFDLDRTDPHRLDEDQGPDDGIACEELPRRGTGAVPPPSSSPSATPSATASRPAVPPSTTASRPVVPSATASRPVVPSATTSRPVTPSTTVPRSATPGAVAPRTVAPSTTAPQSAAPVMPTRGTRAGVGGASGSSDLAVGAGLALAVGSAVAGGWLAVRRLGRGPGRA
ncbi:excalibur calcium-binding protein [Streptomyces cinereoruber]|uniref:excalibur calcium-binding protein n=1 Tax=Streptomyces cinereoruber TaxID=67260 RepID=UPI003BF48124